MNHIQYSTWLPKEQYAKLKILAKERAIGATTLSRIFVMEKIAELEGTEPVNPTTDQLAMCCKQTKPTSDVKQHNDGGVVFASD